MSVQRFGRSGWIALILACIGLASFVSLGFGPIAVACSLVMATQRGGPPLGDGARQRARIVVWVVLAAVTFAVAPHSAVEYIT
jgi:hypothetical protein